MFTVRTCVKAITGWYTVEVEFSTADYRTAVNHAHGVQALRNEWDNDGFNAKVRYVIFDAHNAVVGEVEFTYIDALRTFVQTKEVLEVEYLYPECFSI